MPRRFKYACDPCRPSRELIWCGDSIPEVDISNGDNYTQVISSIVNSILNIVGDYIPLSGTEVGRPVTGSLEFATTDALKKLGGRLTIYTSETDDLNNGSGIHFNSHSDTSTMFLATSSPNGAQAAIDLSTAEIDNPYTALRSKTNSGENSIIIKQTELTLTDEINNKGLVGFDYYGANYDDNTYVQKKYVDDSFVPLSGTVVGKNITGELVLANTAGINISGQILKKDTSTNAILLDGADGLILNRIQLQGTNNTYGGGSFSGINTFSGVTTFTNQLKTDWLFANTASTITAYNRLEGGSDFSADYTDNSFVQKKYVDDKIVYGQLDITFDGVQTVFNIPHGATGVTSSSSMNLTFSDGSNLDFIQSQRSLDGTNITISCGSAPNGVMKLFWQVYV